MPTIMHMKVSADERETPFEQAFANLAYQYLQDKAPRLLDYIVGFQLVDRNEDNTKAIGIFGFKAGDQWLYQPTFFLNGDIKGDELLYMKDADQFVPMRENWVNYLMSRRPDTLGEPTDQTAGQLGVMTPNMEQFSIPPGRYGKYGSTRHAFPVASAPEFLPWAKEALAFVAQWQSRNEHNPLAKSASEKSALERFLASDIQHLQKAYDWCEQFPGVKVGFDRFYGKDFFAKIALQMKDELETETSLLAPVKAAEVEYERYPDLLTGKKEVKQAEEKRGVQVILREDALFPRRHEMTDADREKLLQDGVLIRDARRGEEVSVAYQVQNGHCRLQNPDCTELYQVLLKPGDFVESLIIKAPWSDRGRQKFMSVVALEGERRRSTNAQASAIWVSPDDTLNRETFQKWLEQQSGSTSLSQDTYYVALSPNGQGSVPFRVDESLGDDRYRVHFDDHCKIKGPERPLPKSDFGGRTHQDTGGGHSSELTYGDDCCYGGSTTIVLNRKKGSGFKLVNNDLYIPEDAKLIKIHSPKVVRKPNGHIDWDKTDMDEYERAPGELDLGNLIDVQKEIMNKTAGMRVWQTGSRFVIDSSNQIVTLPKRAALVHLVTDQNLSEDQARAILKSAESYRLPKTYRIKKAAPYPSQGGGGFLTDNPTQYDARFPEPDYFTDNGYNSITAQSPQVQFQLIQGLQSGDTDPEVYNPNTVPDPMALQQAQQAAQSGQKEVFDTAMIGSMLKVVREESLVDPYLPDLMKSLDRIGRILFLFYWHGEEFEDRYGKQDMPELEDSLRNTFEALGDLTLFLKQKTVEPYGDAGGELGEPSIEESARN